MIHAAAGGVGTIAVQLALAWGATVIGTASERNHDYLRSLGAIPVSYGDALRASVHIVENKYRIGTIVSFDIVEQLGVRSIRSQRSAARLAELYDLYAQGKLNVHIRKTFTLPHAADAHREVEIGHNRGKVVLSVE